MYIYIYIHTHTYIHVYMYINMCVSLCSLVICDDVAKRRLNK